MLRSAKKIEINSKSVHGDNVLLLAPVIDICGVIIRADRTTPALIKDFFADFGAEVGRVKYRDELFARVRGTFNILRDEIESFKAQHADLIKEQYDDADKILESKAITAEVEQDIVNLNKPASFLVGDRPYTHKTNVLGSKGNTTIKVEQLDSASCLFSGKQLSITSENGTYNFSEDAKLDDHPIGFMSKAISREGTVIISRELNAKNSIIQSAGVMIFSARDRISLSIGRDIEWVNSPHPENNGPKLAKLLKI